MALEESKSDNNITDLSNLVNSYTKDFKKFFHSLKYNKNKNTLRKNKIYNKNNPDMPKRQSKSIIWEQKSKYNTIHKDSNPIEFFYEFQEFIGRDSKAKENSIKSIKKLPVTERKTKKNNSNSFKRKKSNEKNDIFWEKVKYYMELKNEHLNELTYRLKMKKEENNEDNKSYKKLNKSSFLLTNKKRKPLYYIRNKNENSLSKNFDEFYKYFQKEQKDDKSKTARLYKNKKLINDLDTNNISFINRVKNKDKYNSNDKNKYKKFYEKKMNWIKQRDNKINKERIEKEEHEKYVMNSFSFKPIIDKKSIQIVKKREDFINFMEKKPYTERNYNNIMINKKEIYQKYVATIKPYMSLYYEQNSPFYRKNNLSFTKRKPSVDIGMIHINKGKNIKLIKDKNIENSNNDKSFEIEKKSNINNKSKIFNMFKPDKKNLVKNEKINDKIKEKETTNENTKTIRHKIWWNEIKDKNFNNPKEEENKYNFNNLYKVNVRDNSSWNKICINKIISKTKDTVINDLLN